VGFFTDEELGTLRIKNMILHVVGGTTFTAAKVRKVEHEPFFVGKIVDTAVDAVFTFDATSPSKAELEAIASGRVSFERGAQALALSFNRQHVSGSSDGALFMFELTVRDPNTRIYSLIKYDYREALQQDPVKPDGLLRRIINAFIDDNRAIQKAALFRVVGGSAEDEVSARDRTKRDKPDISDYFRDFLGVTREVSDEELSKKVRGLLQDTLTKFVDHLPNKHIPTAFAEARGLLGKRQKVDKKAIIEAVLHAAGDPTDSKLKQRIIHDTEQRIRKAKLDNLSFKPVPNILRQPAYRRIKTTEGVTVTFPDNAASNLVQVQATANGGQRIVIETQRITNDDLVGKRPG
jgi:hypothetical protein